MPKQGLGDCSFNSSGSKFRLGALRVHRGVGSVGVAQRCLRC